MIYVLLELLVYLTGILVVLAGMVALSCWALGVMYKSVRRFARLVRARA